MLEFFNRIAAKFSPDMGLDIGSEYIGAIECGNGQLWREPSRLMYENGSGRLLALGIKAKLMDGRTTSACRAERPVKNGCIGDYAGMLELLRFCLGRASRLGFLGPRLMLSVPVSYSDVDCRAASDVCRAAGAASVYFVPAPLAAALGAGLPVSQSKAFMILNIGADLSQAAVICMGGMAVFDSVPEAGAAFDSLIIDYCRTERDLIVGRASAEFLKSSGGCVWTEDDGSEMEIKGRDLRTGLPKRIKITAGDMCRVLKPAAGRIASLVQRVLQLTPPGFAGDIAETGLTLCGGGAQLQGLDQFLTRETGLFCQTAPEPAACTLRGIEQMLIDPRIMKAVNAAGTGWPAHTF